MRRKIIAAILIFANVFTIASCNGSFGTPTSSPWDDDDDNEDDGSHSHAQEAVFDAVDDLADALAKCDADALAELCMIYPDSVIEVMPYLAEDTGDGNYKKPDDRQVVRNMIAATINYEIDEDTFSSGFLGSTCSVEVNFSIKDYLQAAEKRETFVNPGDFNSSLNEVTDTIDMKITLGFKKTNGKYLLEIADPLRQLYLYDVEDLNFMRSLFDMVDDMYLTGENYDPETDSYYHTNTFEIVLVLNEQAQEYIWQYVYRVVIETYPKWTNVYQSGAITDRYPSEIHITYSQDEIFEDGFYAILFYNYYDDTVIGMEFNVYEAEKGAQETTAITEETDTEETSEETESGI